jgi:hypothetical protein
MAKALVLCQRKGSIGSDKITLKITTTAIQSLIGEVIGVDPDDLTTLYVRGVSDPLTEFVDLPYNLVYVGNDHQDRAVAAFVEEHRKSFDVVFLNTCPLVDLIESVPLIKELLKDNGLLIAAAISGVSRDRSVYMANMSKSAPSPKFYQYIETPTESVNDEGMAVVSVFEEVGSFGKYIIHKLIVFEDNHFGRGGRRRCRHRKISTKRKHSRKYKKRGSVRNKRH